MELHKSPNSVIINVRMLTQGIGSLYLQKWSINQPKKLGDKLFSVD